MSEHVTPSELHAIGMKAAHEMPTLDLIASMTVTGAAVVCCACLLGLSVKIIADIIMPPKNGGEL